MPAENPLLTWKSNPWQPACQNAPEEASALVVRWSQPGRPRRESSSWCLYLWRTRYILRIPAHNVHDACISHSSAQVIEWLACLMSLQIPRRKRRKLATAAPAAGTAKTTMAAIHCRLMALTWTSKWTVETSFPPSHFFPTPFISSPLPFIVIFCRLLGSHPNC